MPNSIVTADERVLIVGAGPTGLLAANLLGQADIPTLLLEQLPGPGSEARAITIDDEGLRIFHAIGLAEELCAHALLGRSALYVSRQHLLARITPQKQANGYPLISTFHQPVLEQLLLTGARRYPTVTLLFEHTVQSIQQNEQNVELTVQSKDGTLQTVRGAFLLACDGARSPIRQGLGVALHTTLPRSHGERWLVCDTIEQPDHEHNHQQNDEPIIFFCDPQRPAVTVPAPEGRRRWEFMLQADESAGRLNTHEMIHDLIQLACATLPTGYKLPYATTAHIERSKLYTFHTLNASHYRCDRVFLLGDAAHQMPPFGGQGMNSGLRDAYNLCWKIATVLRQQTSPAILDSYQQERQAHATRMILFSAILGTLIMTTHASLATLRDLVLRLIQSIRPLRGYLSDMRVKPTARYPHGLLLSRRHTLAHHLTGSLFPLTRIRETATTASAGYDLDTLQPQHFLLLWLSNETPQILPRLTGDIWSHLDVRFIQVQDTTNSISPLVQANEEIQRTGQASTEAQRKIAIRKIATICDESGHLLRLLRRYKGCLLLLRPDQYVMGVFTVRNIRQVEQELANLCQ